jgi:hypothetical protein
MHPFFHGTQTVGLNNGRTRYTQNGTSPGIKLLFFFSFRKPLNKMVSIRRRERARNRGERVKEKKRER